MSLLLSDSLNMAGLNRLPSFPQVIVKILEALQDDRMDVARLAGLIELDVVLSAKLLAAANSAAYRRDRQILSIREGINSMGWEMVKTLALSAAMHQMLNDFSRKEKFDLSRFWHHSLYSAVLSKLIASRLGKVSEDEAYLAGLLHDVGRLAMRVNFPDLYRPIYESDEGEASMILQEDRIFGSNHCEIGAWLIQDWQVKSFLQDSIAFHHQPPDQLGQTSALVKVTHLSASMSESYPHILAEHVQNAKQWFNLEFQDLDDLSTQSNLQVRAMAASLNINIGVEKLPTGFIGYPSVLGGPGNANENPKSYHGDSASIGQGYMENGISQHEKRNAAHVRSDCESPLQAIVAQTALIDHVEKLISQQADETSFYASLLQVAWMLSGTKQLMYFQVDMAQDLLIGKRMHAQQDWVEQFSFPLQHDVGLISDALIHRAHTHSFQKPSQGGVNVAEQQLIRLCGVDGIICMPMLVAGKQHGVLVFAMDEAAAKDQLNKIFLPMSLARIAATHLDLRNEAIDTEKEQAANEDRFRQEEMDKIIHETSNPLSTIKNYLEIMRRKLIGHPSIDRDLRIVNDEINRVSLLLNQLAESATTDHDQLISLDVNQAVRDVITLHERTYLRPEHINIKLILAEGQPEILCIPYKLRQVLINLIRNAAEAMPNGGDLTISTFIAYSPGKKKWAVIKIQDTGYGINEVVRNMLFTSVQTTKGQQHKGLGLSIVAELMAAMGGEINCATALNEGTSFEIRLPYQRG
ncbi:MAG: HDOD domain-containing protein [Methylophilaceae bacterium]